MRPDVPGAQRRRAVPGDAALGGWATMKRRGARVVAEIAVARPARAISQSATRRDAVTQRASSLGAPGGAGGGDAATCRHARRTSRPRGWIATASGREQRDRGAVSRSTMKFDRRPRPIGLQRIAEHAAQRHRVAAATSRIAGSAIGGTAESDPAERSLAGAISRNLPCSSSAIGLRKIPVRGLRLIGTAAAQHRARACARRRYSSVHCQTLPTISSTPNGLAPAGCASTSCRSGIGAPERRRWHRAPRPTSSPQG